MRRNPDSPWNPAVSVDLAPEEYEKQVVEWLRRSDPGLTDFAVKHLHPVSGAGGEYTFDAVVELTAFNGASFVVLVECKRQK